MNRIAHVLALLLTVAVVLSASISGAAETGLVRLDVTIGRSQVVELKEPFARVSVTNPNIADVFAVTPNQILINGKAVGVTSLVVFYNDRTMFFDVVVQNDTGLLGERLRQLAPRDDIQVTTAQDAIVLRGSVTNEAVITAAGELAGAFVPKGGKVVNLLALAEVKPQQVMLQVHVAEVARESLRELGFSIRALGSTLQGATFPGVPFFPPLGLLGPATSPGFASSVVGSGNPLAGGRGPDFQFAPPQGGSGFFLSSGQRDVAGIVQALASRNLLRTLAKPNLVTQSGKEAKFISGGEFPFPVGREFNSISIEFKEFGVSLLFTPVVVDGHTINLRIRPEVSSLDFSQGLTVQGFNIPVIRKNQALTTINLKDGESFAIAGLLNNEVRQQVAKIPVLGDLPILGALFRSVAFQNNETELLFVVTAKLVAPAAAGTAMSPDPRTLMELRPDEKKEFTLVPGIPGVGEVVDKPFGQSNLDPREKGK